MQKAVPFIAVALILFLLYVMNSPNSGKSTTRASGNSVDELDACAMSHVFIKRQLKAPSTADFPVCREPDTIIVGAGIHWTVRSYVDAQNSFGAMLRSDYMVRMRYEPSTDKWALVEHTLVER